jgi:hypothetical protein
MPRPDDWEMLTKLVEWVIDVYLEYRGSGLDPATAKRAAALEVLDALAIALREQREADEGA